MNLKTTYILFGILIAAMAGLALTQIFGLGKSDSKSDFVFPDLHAKKAAVEEKDIDSIRIEHPQSEKAKAIAFGRDDDKNWQMEEPGRFRVDQFAVDNLVRDVIGAIKEKVEVSKDLKEYELDKPRVTVAFKRGEQEWTLNIGKESQGSDPYVFVTTSGRPKEPVAVKKSRLQPVFKTANEFRSRTLIAVRSLEIEQVELQAAGKKDVAVAKGTGGRWSFKQPATFGAADYEGEGPPSISTEKGGKITGVQKLIQQITSLQVEGQGDFIADSVGEPELKDKYGLEGGNPATLKIVVASAKKAADADAKTTTTETLLIGKRVPEEKPEKKDDKKDEKKTDANKSEFYYARLSHENNVVKVAGKNVDALVQVAGDPDALRERDLAQFNRDKVDAIVVENAEGTVRLFKAEAEPWKLWRDKTGANAEDSAVRALLDALDPKRGGKRRVESFPTIKPEQAQVDKKDKPMVISLWEGGLKKQEKKDAEPELTEPKKPTVRLTIGKQEKDRGLVYVLREIAGEKAATLMLVKDKEAGREGLVDRVTPGPLAYLDRKIPTYSAADASRINHITLTRGGETIQLKSEKSGELDVWKFDAPKDLAGRQAGAYAVRDILFGVQHLTASRVAAEKPDDKQLENFGLKPPQIEVTLRIAAKESKEEKKEAKEKKDAKQEKKESNEEKYVYRFGKETPDKSGLFVQTDKSNFVYVVPAAILTTLQAELRDKTLFTFDVDKVSGVKLVGWKNVVGQDYTLNLKRNSKNSWIAEAPPGYKVEPETAEAFLQSLSHLQTSKFLNGPPKPEYGLDAAKNPGLLTIEIAVAGVKEPFKLTIGNLDSADKAYYATSGNAKNQVLLVPEDTFKRVLEKPSYFTKAGS